MLFTCECWCLKWHKIKVCWVIVVCRVVEAFAFTGEVGTRGWGGTVLNIGDETCCLLPLTVDKYTLIWL